MTFPMGQRLLPLLPPCPLVAALVTRTKLQVGDAPGGRLSRSSHFPLCVS